MTDNNAFERFVADHLADDGSGHAQAERIAALIDERTDEQRQWPRWLALIKEPPMRTNSHLTVGSPTVRLAAILAATMLLAVTLAAAGVAGQRLLAANGPMVVAQDGSGTYETITEAVAAAQVGDEILIKPGTYVEAVVIDKDITLRGDGRVEDIVITAPDGGPTAYSGPVGMEPYAVLLSQSSGRLSGLTFRGEPSVVIINGGSPTVEGNVFDDVGYSFGERQSSFGGSSVVAISASAHIIGNTLIDGGPVAAFDVAKPIIEGNELRNGPHIWVSGTGAGTQIIDNTVEDAQLNGIGAYYTSGDTTISGNALSRIGENGISVDIATGVISGNDISEAPYGIWVDGQDLEVTGNAVRGSEVGLSWYARRGTLEGNTVTDGRWGIVIASGEPLVSGNTACDNTVDFFVGVPAELDLDPATFPAEPDVSEGDNDFCEDEAE